MREPGRQETTGVRARDRGAVRGFTLIELMVTLGISGIVGAGVVAASLWQVRNQVGRMAELDARVQAQTVIAAIAEAASLAGYGFAHAHDAVGVASTGVCLGTGDYAPGTLHGRYRPDCAKRDNGGNNDRLRFSYADPGQYAYLSPSAPTAGPCNGDGSPPDPGRLHLAERGTAVNTGQGSYGRGTSTFLGGRCQGAGPPSAATDLIGFSSDSTGPKNGCYEVRDFSRGDLDGGPSVGMSCPNGYAPGFTQGVAEIREFFSDVDPATRLPRLMMAALAWGQWPSVVAVGVTRFEVRYGFDTSDSRDGRLHACPSCTEDPLGTDLGGPRAWCREVRSTTDGGDCALRDGGGALLSTQQLQQRVIALHVTFDLVAPPQSRATTGLLGLAPGAKTWTFTRLFQLPNLAI